MTTSTRPMLVFVGLKEYIWRNKMKRKSLRDMPLIVYISFIFFAIAALSRAIYLKIKDY